MGLVTAGLASTHCMASVAADTPDAEAKDRMASMVVNMWSCQ